MAPYRGKENFLTEKTLWKGMQPQISKASLLFAVPYSTHKRGRHRHMAQSIRCLQNRFLKNLVIPIRYNSHTPEDHIYREARTST
mgnify:CR=1 FL=1